jgi:dUTP pyrophosphatase
MEKIGVKINLNHSDAKMPFYGSEEAAGFDLHSVEDRTIKPKETALIGTGVHMELPKGYCVQFWDRSGIGVKGITKFAGVIDSDYRGELKVVLHNTTEESFEVNKGDRIIQGLIVPSFQAEFEKIDKLNESGRGEKGFHSTGRS